MKALQKQLLREVILTLIFLVGFSLLIYGVHMVSAPWAYIIAGALLLTIVSLGIRG